MDNYVLRLESWVNSFSKRLLGTLILKEEMNLSVGVLNFLTVTFVPDEVEDLINFMISSSVVEESNLDIKIDLFGGIILRPFRLLMLL